MGRNHLSWKKWTRWALGLLLAIDVALLFVNWRNGGVEAQAQNLRALKYQFAVMSKDVRQAQDIEKRLPEIQQQCDAFFKEQLSPAAGGYSAVVADLGEVAGKAGLRTSGVSYNQRPVKDRGVVEVEVAATVEGDYPSLVRFINGLERSERFYLVDKLALASSTSGGIKLTLELRTYFRSS
jgi:Tfp pilus assembly protein PilO